MASEVVINEMPGIFKAIESISVVISTMDERLFQILIAIIPIFVAYEYNLYRDRKKRNDRT